MTQPKLQKRERIASILAASLELAKQYGYQNITRDAIASKARMSTGLVSAHMGTMPALRRAIVREAIRVEYLPVIAQAVAMRDSHVKKCPQALIDKAVLSLHN